MRGRSGAKEIKLSGNKTVVRHCVYMRDTRDFNRQRGDVTYQQGVTTYKRRLGENVTTTTLTGFLITASLRITLPEQTRHLQLPTEFRRFVVERGGGAGTRLATHRALAPWEGLAPRHRCVLNLRWRPSFPGSRLLFVVPAWQVLVRLPAPATSEAATAALTAATMRQRRWLL